MNGIIAISNYDGQESPEPEGSAVDHIYRPFAF